MVGRTITRVAFGRPRGTMLALSLLALLWAAFARAERAGANTGQPSATSGGAMVLAGSFWLGDQPAAAGSIVVALVGETVCGVTLVTEPTPGLNYQLAVLANTVRSGCGTDGAPITVRLAGAVAGPRSGSMPRFQAGRLVVADLVVP